MAFRSRLAVTALITLLAALTASVRDAGAQTAQTSVGRLVGRIIDQENGRPVSGAIVRVDSAATALSDANGWFGIDEVVTGTRRIAVEMLGYETREASINVRAGQVNEVRLPIAREAIALDPVLVSVRSGWLEASGFYERERTSAGGHFISKADIDKRNTIQLTDLLADIPGVRVHFLDAGRKHVRLNRGNAGNVHAFDPRQELILPGCEPDLYLDGQLYRERIPRDGTERRVDGFDIVEPSIIEGVEVYTGSTAPLQYQSSCGVILVWTRRGRPEVRVSTAGPTSGASPASPPSTSPPIPAPSVTPGVLARVTRRLGGSVQGGVESIDADSVRLESNGATHSLAITDLRKLEVDAGLASPLDRAWRGAKWGFMLGVAAVAIGAAIEEFSEAQNGNDGAISNRSPRKPGFALKVIGFGTAGGGLLGGALWRYRRWEDVRIR